MKNFSSGFCLATKELCSKFPLSKNLWKPVIWFDYKLTFKRLVPFCTMQINKVKMVHIKYNKEQLNMTVREKSDKAG